MAHSIHCIHWSSKLATFRLHCNSPPYKYSCMLDTCVLKAVATHTVLCTVLQWNYLNVALSYTIVINSQIQIVYDKISHRTHFSTQVHQTTRKESTSWAKYSLMKQMNTCLKSVHVPDHDIICAHTSIRVLVGCFNVKVLPIIMMFPQTFLRHLYDHNR